MVSQTCQKVSAITFLILGVILLILALAGKTPLRNYVDNMIRNQVRLTPGTDTFNTWTNPPISPYDDIYVFNITNPVEFNNGAKPSLQLVGPFVYRKDEEKLNANVSGNLTYVYYYDYEKYYYEADVTQDKQNTFKLTDKVYIPNIPLLSVLSQLNDVNLPAIFRKLLEEFLITYEKSHGILGLTLNGTVEGILWGMPDPIMSKLYDLKLTASPNFSLQTNGSTDPAALTIPTIVYSGHDNISQLAAYRKFHGRSSSGCWGTDEANVINGTDGTQFAPLLIYNKTKRLSIYTEQLYRSVDMEYSEDSSYNGIQCYNYRIPDWALQNVTYNPDNIGYYAYTYTGVLNLTKCSSGVPLYITKPYFLDGDLRLFDNVTLDAKPNKTLHDTYLCAEPYTGVVIDGHKRIQVSVQTQTQKNATGVLGNLTDAFIPVVYVDEHGSITDDLTAKLKSSLLTPILATHVAFYGLLSLGAIFALGAIVLLVRIVILRYSHGSDDRVALIRDSEDANSDNEQFLSFDGNRSNYYEATE